MTLPYFLFALLILSSCSFSQQTETEISTQTEEIEIFMVGVKPDKFQTLIKKPGVVLDVRTPKEVAKGAIKGAVNIDFYDANFKKEISKLKKTEPVYIYCARGGRSNKAAQIMVELGFTKIYELEGGYLGWASKGFPVEK